VSETDLVTSLRPKVVDGTTCYRGIRDICVGGVCREIPCDLNMESNAVEDGCGICRGDSTSCTLKQGTVSFATEASKEKHGVVLPLERIIGSRTRRVEILLNAKTLSRHIIVKYSMYVGEHTDVGIRFRRQRWIRVSRYFRNSSDVFSLNFLESSSRF